MPTPWRPYSPTTVRGVKSRPYVCDTCGTPGPNHPGRAGWQFRRGGSTLGPFGSRCPACAKKAA